jgi:transcriptional regulator with XRE-family HTH domain
MQYCMTSRIASGAVHLVNSASDNASMPRRPRANPKPQRQPTFIRAWRKERGLTLAQLSDQLETLHELAISDGQLSRIENGKQPYSQDLLEAIADVLKTEPASLIMRDPNSRAIWSVYDTLSPVERKQVDDYAAFIAAKTA